MTVRKRTKLERLLTEVELELMNVIWEIGECTVKDVQTALAKERDLAYTSVATIMKILEQKGALKSLKRERAHVYHSVVSRDEYEAMTLRHLATHVFRGDPTSMVARLLDESNLSQAEVQAIRKLLEERLKP
jgi:predicted transcriptional regulator